MADAKNGTLVKEEISLCVKALTALKASVLRSKTKDAADADMVAIYDRRVIAIDALIAKMYSKELF